MNFAAYCQLEAVNASSLKNAAESAEEYQWALTHPKADTAAMFKGRAIHCAILEPDEFFRRYVLWPGPRTTKEYHAFIKTVPEGVEVLSSADYDDCIGARNSVQSHPFAAGYLASGVFEHTLQWVDEETGLGCKARLDWLDLDRGWITDLKSGKDIAPRSFERTTHDLLYHMSAAHYIAGVRAVTGQDCGFRFIAVKQKGPWAVRCGPIAEDALYCGEQERRRLLRLVADCTASGAWPGAYPDEDEFDLPAWFYAQGERADEAATKILEGLAPQDGARL